MKNSYSLEDLNAFVSDCYLDYAAASIEIGDPAHEWNDAHHPDPARLGGNKTTPLLKKDHAIHGVIQSEVYQHPCIFGWEKSFLPVHLHHLFDKWIKIKGRMGGSANTIRQKLARQNNIVLAMEALDYTALSENGKKGGGKHTLKQIETRKENAKKTNNHPNARDWKSRAGQLSNRNRWMCLVTGHISTCGALSNYQKRRGIDTSNRVKLTPEEMAFIYAWDPQMF